MNQVVTALETTSDGWAKVTLASGATGWCSMLYLISFEGATGTGTRTTTAKLHMRAGAGTSFASLDTLPKGKLVAVTGYSGEWAVSSIDGRAVYLHSGYLR